MDERALGGRAIGACCGWSSSIPKSLKRGRSGRGFVELWKLSSKGRYSVETAEFGGNAVTRLKSVGALILTGAVDLRLNDILALPEAREAMFLPSSITHVENDDARGGPGLGRSS